MASLTTAMLLVIASLTRHTVDASEAKVNSLSFNYGSTAGGTRITIFGTGFSPDPFSFGEGNEDKGNLVFLQNSFFSIPCDVIPYLSNTEKIVCDTRSLKDEGTFSVYVIVDGVPVERYCNKDPWCEFTYREANTPTISSVTPMSGLPGTKLTIRGKIITDIYDPSKALEDEDDNYEGKPQILRVYWGNYFCDPVDPETEDFYNIALDSADSQYGVIECVPVGTYIASQSLSYLVSDEYGRSASDKSILKVSGRNQLYLYQAHADVLDVSPTLGSTQGGTVLTIHGQYFDERNTIVFVQGVPCEIFNISTTEILCVTGPAPPEQSIYPGGRGLEYEVWRDTSVNLDDADWNTSAADYNSTVVLEASSTPEHVFGEEENFVSRLTGFFVPPRTGEYRFFVRGDDLVDLWLSSTASADNLTKIAYISSHQQNWHSVDSQSSEKLTLIGGQSYYMEARHREYGGSDFVQVGVAFFDVPLNTFNTSTATNELQEIATTSTVHKELQTLTVVGGSYETQKVYVELPSCPTTVASSNDSSSACNISGVYRLQFDGQMTGDIDVTASAAEVQAALNAILDPDTVAVTQSSDGYANTYTVEFHIAQEGIALLTVDQDDPNLVVMVTQVKSYAPVELSEFALLYDGITSVPLSPSSTAEEVQNALLEMFSVKCSTSGSIKGYLVQDYEGDSLGWINGEVINSQEPYCGRWLIKNPYHIFYAGRSRTSGSEKELDSFDIRQYDQLCFGHRGGIQSFIQVRIHWMDQEFNDRVNWINLLDSKLQSSESWLYTCLDVHTLIQSTWVYNQHLSGTALRFERIRVFRIEGQDLFLDNLYIGRSVPQYVREQRAASPNGIFVLDASVHKTDLSFNITLTPAACGNDFPLIGIKDANISTNSSSEVAYWSETWPSDTMISVQRRVPATPPIGGTFEIELYGVNFEVSAQATADQLKEALQANLDIGSLEVFREGSCSGYSWEVEWLSKGGKQPLMQVNGSGLTGYEVGVTSHRVEEGHVFLAPIPGEFLRLAHPQPQVEVIVNNVPSSCSLGQCSFEYSDSVTPKILSSTPANGSAYHDTVLTITGSGFSVNAGENNVTIGGAVCDVVSFNESSVSCAVTESAAGLYNISLMVEGRGNSLYPNGPITFQYELGVTNVSPTSGSTAGGTRVNITGYGFSEDMQSTSVTIGGQSCIIDTITYDEIQCVIALDTQESRRRRRSLQVDLIIVVNSQTLTEEGIFTFDPSLTPTILGISPNVSSVKGGGILTISGSGFGSSGAKVTVGNADCVVTAQADGEVNCTIPEHSPGTFYVILEVTDQGFAEANGMTFVYQLDVTGIFPDSGSVQGVTAVTIAGVGFGTNTSDVSVSLGGVACTVNSVADSSIQCLTTSSEATHSVDNFGKHQSYGIGYKWNPQVLSVTAGDVVVWQWSVQQQVTGIGYAVMQTADADAVMYDGQGFYSGERSSDGNFAYRFSTPGTYYYSSGPVDEDGNLYMKGIVKVNEPTATSNKVVVTVGGYDALHDTQSDVGEPMSSDNCSGSSMAIPSCNVPPAEQPDSSSFYFSYWACKTPIVDDFGPKVGTPDQIINVTGLGFSDVPCENEISFGSYSCIPQMATNVSVTCLMDTAGSMPVGQPLSISLVVKNLGRALVQIPMPADRGFTLKPQIDALSTHSGGITGGTEVVISGNGFSSDTVSVWIGSSGCLVQSVTYMQVVCKTTPATAGSAELRLEINSQWAACNDDCSFEFSEAMTPVVDGISPTTVSGASTSIQILGYGFVNETSDITVMIGGVACVVTNAYDEEIQCDVGYVSVGDQPVVVNIAGKGDAYFNVSNIVTSAMVIDSIDPSSGSTEGGQSITILGSGFVDGSTTVDIDGSDCVIESVSLYEIICVTSDHAAGVVDLVVTSQGEDYPAANYEYSASDTPTISSITPTSGVTGDSITISGSSFSTNTSDVAVFIDGVVCTVSSAADDSIACSVGPHSAGTYAVVIYIKGKGLSGSDTMFEYELTLSSVSPVEGSFGGGRILSIDGAGFDETAIVMVCNNSCPISNSTSSLIECEVPANSGSGEVVCDVTVTLASGATSTESDAFTYKTSLTPVIDSVEPRRGGTAGGTTLNITGSGFESSGNVVTVGGSPCTVQSESTTEIICETGPHSPPEMTKVRVEVGNNGIATQDNADFYYIDVWSSRYTWGNQDPPVEGDFVVVPAGQTLLLDISTPILKMLLIQGGKVMFDEADIELHAENILIVDGGHLQVGTEEEPFQHEATIMMHGHVRSTELPLFGAKTLAVRNGTLDLHGKPVPITWTRLAQTAGAGATRMVLEKSVTWKAGDQIVIASTGHRHSQRQNEFLTITAVSGDGTVLDFEPALEYEHYGFTQVVEGVVLEMRAEVGMVTRNVKFRGSVQEEWVETYEACPEEFDTNQFATQTCFLGRFGEETGSDQFGAQMMLFAKYQDQQLVKGRIEYVEVTHAGQAFRLGRYPIHFHLNGDVSGSYVRGCGIHHTFNRAVTIHAVHNLLVEHNVAYNVMGHAYFLEDGIETGNIIQYNLGVFVRPSSSLLNVDITPATYWVTNPDNIVRHNAAAGGSHFGFWYNMPTNPGGPSFTSSICPRKVPLGEFRNNSAHAQGWYGIWIFPTYTPKVGGGCNSWEDEPAKYYSLYAWETERGAEAVVSGAIQFHDFVISDADKAGVEYQDIGAPWGGALVKNLTVIGYSNISDPSECTEAGVQGPKADGLTVDGAKFINFDQSRCAAFRTCGHCKVDQGGFSVRTQGLEFLNSPNKAAFKWQHEVWIEDMDGTLTGMTDYIVLPSNPNLPSDHCTQEAGYSVGFSGSHCDTTVRLHRLAFNNPLPSSLRYKNTLFTNAQGTSRIPYHKKRITHPEGWMITLIDGDNYNMIFENVDHVTNISYTARFYNFDDGDYVLINHNFTQRPDKFATIGIIENSTESVPTYAANENGDWHFENETRILTYIVSGKGESGPVNRDVDLDVYQCFYLDCLPPVPEIPEPPPAGRPVDARLWSDPLSWDDVESGWSGNLNGSVTNVMIMPSVWMVADVQLPVMNKLFIYGALEIEDSQDNKLEATYILIQGGRLVIGFSDSNPFQHEMKILLNGHHFTPDQPLPNGPNLGSKALGVFGGLDIHGKNRSIYWTQLSATVSPGDSTLTVKDETDWEVGDEIVVATTSYEAWQTETFKIEAVTDASTFQINGTFAFRHIAEYNDDYVLAAEVGLLTRNIKIEGNDYDLLFDESYGARVLVGRFFQDGVQYKGYARISNVEFYHSGQEGWSDFFDPRYSLAFLDVGEITAEAPSSVKGCSFHNGFSPAIGVFGTDGLVVRDNVIHHTVGSAIIVRDDNTQLIHNLVTLMVFPGTYQDRFESENLDWNAGIEVDKADKVVLINNTVAGSERVAFKVRGEACFDPPNPLTDWYGNVGHSTLHGIHIFLSPILPCTKVANFLIYKSWDFGIYHQSTARVLVTDVKLVDNKIAILPIVFSPAALSHKTSDKFVRVKDSLIVGVSDSFECSSDSVQPENAGQSSKQRGPRAPGGGHTGLLWSSFLSGSNGAPFKPFHGANSYPMINGITEVQNVDFRSFGEHCGKTDAMIVTNAASEDALHPIEISGITMTNVDEARKVFLHRPNVGSVNPSDCVDMDCDGMKKAMIRDLDGSLLGSPGTLIPQSEFEWDGDPRRGLGDYRIPKVMLTRPDGSRIPVEDKAPNKGIYRGHNNECTFNSNWRAYECHGIDHRMLVVESMDADTEVRRLTPLAMYSDSYVDLINGPQDNGWCHGYTCQERISTLYTIVATGKDYEVYFTSTNPQVLRLHLLNSDENQAVVLGIWYANPQRLDVYYKNEYVTPTNADYSTGEFTWKAKDPSLPADQYNPSVTSNVHGENYFERDTQTLWLLVKGPVPVEIRTTAVIMVTFGVPAVSVDNFYEDANLVRNLAALLNVDQSQIRVVDVVSESSGRRRRRAAEGEAEVIMEIGPPPSETIDSPGSDTVNQTSSNTTTAAPPSGSTPAPGGNLNFDDLVEVQSILADTMQSGDLGDALNITVTSMLMSDPVAVVVDPTGGVRATNETGGSSDVPSGTKTYDELMREEEEQENANLELEIEYRTPVALVLHTQPDGAREGAVLTQQPTVYAVDALGNIVPQLGARLNPWQLTVSINPSTPSADTIQLTGNLTVAFDGSWANFTDLTLDVQASGVILDFQITLPNTSSLEVSAQPFDVAVRPYYLMALTSPDAASINSTFDVIVELRDEITMLVPQNLSAKGLEWHALIALNMPTNYRGQLRGQLETTFDLATAQAQFTNLSIDAAGVSYILAVSVETIPSSAYQLGLMLDPFDVVDPSTVNVTGPTRRLMLRFDVSYDEVVAGKEDLLEINFLNYINGRYTGVLISSVLIERGSVLISFDMQGDVDTAVDELWMDLQGGSFSLEFDGYTLQAESYLLVNGEEYGVPTEPPAGFPIWAIAVIVVVVLVVVLLIVLVIVKLCCTRGKTVSSVEAAPLTESFKLKEFTSSGSLNNPLLKVDHEPDGSAFDPYANGSPNTPRRTPEVEVTALPPGFTESTGQEERLLEERIKMMIMVKNSDGTFQKLGAVQANKVGTARALREDVKRALPAKLRDKKFILLDETLKDIDGPREKKAMLSEIYRSECVLMRWVRDQDVAKLCVCGLVGQFECSLCRRQTYCSPQCQSTDWVRHSMQCSSYAVASVDNPRL
ncbi:fibrocystin-L-like isoform X1 [Acanthaster planci]|uniref:Fibrocystin-L-like isoform X1 n=1 Tax=Acanthaster planci TaxID=133434 RepID=A0A8B7YWH8_ACAPL|nr:fibrocystin-L-like isoform X1 [Acanthaster planci]